METIKVTILQPEAKVELDVMESKKLIKVSKGSNNGGEKKPLQRGCMKGLVLYIADDFDAPLEDFKEYM